MKTQLIRTFLIGAALSLALPLMAADLAGSKDNPFIKRFDGSQIVRYKALNYDALNFMGKDPHAFIAVEGKVIRLGYVVPAAASSSALEVYRNYEADVKDKGFDLIRDGSADDLRVGDDQGGRGSFEDLANQHGMTGAPGYGSLQGIYYVYGTKSDPAGTIHLSVAVGELTSDSNAYKAGDIAIFVECVQEKPVANKMVDGTASDMSKQIAATGSVNLYGIYFDTNKTDVKPESKPTLDEVGKLMASDATLKLKVVGHTDNVGTADYNNDLSMRGAQSVVHELVASYSVSPMVELGSMPGSCPVIPLPTVASVFPWAWLTNCTSMSTRARRWKSSAPQSTPRRLLPLRPAFPSPKTRARLGSRRLQPPNGVGLFFESPNVRRMTG